MVGDRDQAAGIVNLWGLLWEVGGGDADALQGFIAREDRVTESVCGVRVSFTRGLREVEGERAFFHYRLYLSSLFLQK